MLKLILSPSALYREFNAIRGYLNIGEFEKAILAALAAKGGVVAALLVLAQAAPQYIVNPVLASVVTAAVGFVTAIVNARAAFARGGPGNRIA